MELPVLPPLSLLLLHLGFPLSTKLYPWHFLEYFFHQSYTSFCAGILLYSYSYSWFTLLLLSITQVLVLPSKVYFPLQEGKLAPSIMLMPLNLSNPTDVLFQPPQTEGNPLIVPSAQPWRSWRRKRAAGFCLLGIVITDLLFSQSGKATDEGNHREKPRSEWEQEGTGQFKSMATHSNCINLKLYQPGDSWCDFRGKNKRYQWWTWIVMLQWEVFCDFFSEIRLS